MWRALLRLALLHLDATKPASAPGTIPGKVPGTVPGTTAVHDGAAASSRGAGAAVPGVGTISLPRRSLGGAATVRHATQRQRGGDGLGRGGIDADAGSARRTRGGEGGGEEGGGAGAGAEEAAAAAAVVSLPVAMETCGYLLPLWGYRWADGGGPPTQLF